MQFGVALKLIKRFAKVEEAAGEYQARLRKGVLRFKPCKGKLKLLGLDSVKLITGRDVFLQWVQHNQIHRLLMWDYVARGSVAWPSEHMREWPAGMVHPLMSPASTGIVRPQLAINVMLDLIGAHLKPQAHFEVYDRSDAFDPAALMGEETTDPAAVSIAWQIVEGTIPADVVADWLRDYLPQLAEVLDRCLLAPA